MPVGGLIPSAGADVVANIRLGDARPGKAGRVDADVPRQSGPCQPANISPFNRTIVYLSLCAVSNHIRQFKRAEWIAHRDFTPIQPLADDCLEELLAKEREAAAG